MPGIALNPLRAALEAHAAPMLAAGGLPVPIGAGDEPETAMKKSSDAEALRLLNRAMYDTAGD